MFQTNSKQCQDTRRGGPSHGGSRGNCCGDRNGDCGNSTSINSLFAEKLEDSCISNLSITKNRPQLNQLKKNLDALPGLCQDKHYDYIIDTISTNTKPTQDYFLSNHPIKTRWSSKHHVKLGPVDPNIGLDLPSGTSAIDTKKVDIPPFFNPNLQEQSQLNYDQESKMKLKNWNMLEFKQ